MRQVNAGARVLCVRSYLRLLLCESNSVHRHQRINVIYTFGSYALCGSDACKVKLRSPCRNMHAALVELMVTKRGCLSIMKLCWHR